MGLLHNRLNAGHLVLSGGIGLHSVLQVTSQQNGPGDNKTTSSCGVSFGRSFNFTSSRSLEYVKFCALSLHYF